jgi:hypothetical protein
METFLFRVSGGAICEVRRSSLGRSLVCAAANEHSQRTSVSYTWTRSASFGVGRWTLDVGRSRSACNRESAPLATGVHPRTKSHARVISVLGMTRVFTLDGQRRYTRTELWGLET